MQLFPWRGFDALPRHARQQSLCLPDTSLLPGKVDLQANVGSALHEGLHESLAQALAGLRADDRTRASVALDNGLRTATVGAYAAPGAFETALEQIRAARIAVQQGRRDNAIEHLSTADQVLQPFRNGTPPLRELDRYVGAKVIDPQGAIIGEVDHASPDELELALGGWRAAWGFVDFGPSKRVSVPASAAAFGPPRRIGLNLVAVPTLATLRTATISG